MMVSSICEHKAIAIDLHTRQADEYDEKYRMLEQDPYRSTFTYGRKKIEELLQRELQRIPPGGRVADIGCGIGFYVRRLRDRGFDVTGVEPAEGMLKLSKKNNPGATIVRGDVEAIPLPDQSFDAVVCIEVIRYLRTPDRALREIARILRPGGLAVVTAAPLWSLNGISLINQLTSRVTIPTFTRIKYSFLSTRSAEQAARTAGFSSVEVHGAFLGPWATVGRLSQTLLARGLRVAEPLDNVLADCGPLRDLTNHLVIVARR